MDEFIGLNFGWGWGILRGFGWRVVFGLVASAPALVAAESERPLPLVVAVGSEVRRTPDWHHDLGRAVAYCQDTLGEATGRRFRVVEVVGWHPGGSRLETMLESLRRQVGSPPGAVVIGLTRRPVTPSVEWGLTSYREALTVISLQTLGNRYGFALAHEIAHVFGAVHVDEPGAVMARSRPGPRLAAVNESLVRLHRERSFSRDRFPLSSDRLAQALELYRGVARDDPESLAMQVRVELEAGLDARALETAERLVAMDTDPQASMLRGIALRRLGHAEAALAVYDRAIVASPRDADLHYNRAAALEAQDAAGAERAYRRALEIDAGHAHALSGLARLLARSGRAEEARGVAERAVALAPRLVAAHVNLALAELESGHPEAALETAGRALALDAECAEARGVEAAALLELGRVAAARRAFEAGVGLAPDSAELQEGLGRAHREEGRLGGARRTLERSLELEPKRASALVELGLVHLAAKRHQEAAAHFERAAGLEPDRLAAWVDLAAARLLLGEAAATEAACLRALALEPDSHRALTTLGTLRRTQGRLPEALELLERARRLAPADLDVAASLADAHLALGRRRSARDLYQEVVMGRPADGFAHNNLAVVLYRLGDLPGAVAHAERARQLGIPVAPAFLRVLNEKLASN